MPSLVWIFRDAEGSDPEGAWLRDRDLKRKDMLVESVRLSSLKAGAVESKAVRDVAASSHHQIHVLVMSIQA